MQLAWRRLGASQHCGVEDASCEEDIDDSRTSVGMASSEEEEDTLVDSPESDLVGGIDADEAESNVVESWAAAVEIDWNCRRHIQQSLHSLILFERRPQRRRRCYYFYSLLPS